MAIAASPGAHWSLTLLNVPYRSIVHVVYASLRAQGAHLKELMQAFAQGQADLPRHLPFDLG
jgi:hypothetical protein